MIKNLFSIFRIQKWTVFDNVPFNIYRFKQYAMEWGIEVSKSSPNFYKPIDLTENGVHISKIMLKKQKKTNSDLQLYLLCYRIVQ